MKAYANAIRLAVQKQKDPSYENAVRHPRRLPIFRADATAARNSDGLISFTPGKTLGKHNAGLELCLCPVDVGNNYLLVSHGVGWRIVIHEKAVAGAHSKTAEGHSQGDTPI